MSCLIRQRKIFRNIKKKKRKTNASRFFCRNESFPRLLNLERDTPKEGGLDDNLPSKTGSTRSPARVLSPVTRGDFCNRGDSRVSLFACPASSPFYVVRAILSLSIHEILKCGPKGKEKKKKKTQRRDR